jgi:transposase
VSRRKEATPPEFKEDAVRLVTEAARNLGIHPSLLQRWKTELASAGPNAFPGKGRLSPEQEELQRLRKENQRLKMERDILKKAAAFFAKESM